MLYITEKMAALQEGKKYRKIITGHGKKKILKKCAVKQKSSFILYIYIT
jgi:hypothetical protein